MYEHERQAADKKRAEAIARLKEREAQGIPQPRKEHGIPPEVTVREPREKKAPTTTLQDLAAQVYLYLKRGIDYGYPLERGTVLLKITPTAAADGVNVQVKIDGQSYAQSYLEAKNGAP